MRSSVFGLVFLFAATMSAVAQDARQSAPVQMAFAGCGWYIVLGCSSGFSDARNRMNALGGPMAGGGAGLKVANTSEYPNFRNGFHCVVDGPYNSQSAAQSNAWNEAVPDAYVKSGC